MALDPETWAEIRQCWERGDAGVAALSRRFGAAPSTIRSRAKREGWMRRPAKQRVKPRAKLPPVNVELDDGLLSRPQTLGARLKRLVEVQLSRMERFMITATPSSGQDAEREVRAIKGLVENLNKVSEAAHAIDGTGGADKTGARDAWLEAERLRREITERLERLDREWLAGGKPE